MDVYRVRFVMSKVNYKKVPLHDRCNMLCFVLLNSREVEVKAMLTVFRILYGINVKIGKGGAGNGRSLPFFTSYFLQKKLSALHF